MTNKRQLMFECIPAEQLAKYLIADINESRRRVHLQAMDFDGKGPMKNILDALNRQAIRGSETSVAFDWRMYVLNPFTTIMAAKDLVHGHISVVRVGHPWLGTPIARRSHVKLHVIDDVVYIGGVNLAGESFENRDMMMRTKSSELAKIARMIQLGTYGRMPDSDMRHVIDDRNTLLVDGGMNSVSVIIDESICLAKTAKKVWYLSQFAPDPMLARAIKCIQARMIKFNTPNSQSSLIGKIVSRIDNVTGNIRNDYVGKQKIHAKILIVQSDNGKYRVVTGSHNFAASGVTFGTREIALLSSDQSLARDLISFIESS